MTSRGNLTEMAILNEMNSNRSNTMMFAGEASSNLTTLYDMLATMSQQLETVTGNLETVTGNLETVTKELEETKKELNKTEEKLKIGNITKLLVQSLA